MMKHQKQLRLSECDIKILNLLKDKPKELFSIHDALTEYSDQEVSLNLSWLERKNFIKKSVFHHPAGGSTITYRLDTLGKDYFNNKTN
jgi:DNA-binding HxlR family transcriptional regulator